MRSRSLAAHAATIAFLVTIALLASAIHAATAFANPGRVTPPPTALEAHARPLARAPTPLAPLAPLANPAAAATLDGEWREFGLLQAMDQLALYDALHDELLSVGGSRRSNWALPLAGTPAWQPLPATASAPYLDTHLAATDPGTGLVYFVGYGNFGVEARTLDPRTGAVVTIAAAGPQPAVFPPGSLVFDPVQQRLLMYGGMDFNSLPTSELWALDLLPSPAWSQLSPAGASPPAMYRTPAVLDPVRRRMVIPDASVWGSNDVWALALDGPPEWLHFPSNGLPNGWNPHPFVFDATADRFWTVDGQGDVYWLSPVTWQWAQAPVVGAGPSARRRSGLALDALRHRLLLSGGDTPSGDDIHSDTWALPLDGVMAWTQLVAEPVRPPIRGGAGDGLDLSRHRLVVFGGSNELGGFRNDTWALDLGATPAWSPLATVGGPPPPRYWHLSEWDEVRDQLLVYGGYSGDTNNPLGDLWALSFGGGTPAWAPLAPAGPAPPDRMLSAMVRDPARDRFLLFFGYDGAQVLGDVWELRLSPSPAWRQLALSGTPPQARAATMAAFDPVHDRVLVFGGGTQDDYLGDLWALQFGGGGDGAWQPLAAPGGPSRRNLGLLRLDTGHNRLLLFGGYGVHHVSGNTTYVEWLNDTWALNLSGTPAWQELAPSGFLPPPRDRANGAYDPFHDRLVLACGAYGANDTWALEFGDSPTPTLLALASRDVTADRVRLVWAGAGPGEDVTAYRRSPGGTWSHLARLFADGEGLVRLEDRDVTPGAVLEYRLGVTGESGETFFGATLVEVPVRALTLAGRSEGGHVTFTVELPSGEPASLALFDLAGRRVWSTGLGELGAGTHTVTIAGAALPPAHYFGRLVQGGLARDARVVVTR